MMWPAAKALMARDLLLLWRRRGDALQPALFALLVVVLFALALGGEAQALAKVASAVLWLAVLLAGLLSLDTLFRGDAEDGSLEQWMLAPAPLWLLDEPYANLDLDGINLVNRMVQAHLRSGGAALLTTHGAYAAPPVRTRMLTLERPA